MTRKSFQRGYVSKPIHSDRGTKFIIKWRVWMGEHKSKQMSKTVYTSSRKEAAALLAGRIRESSNQPIEARELTFSTFLERYWRPYLDRKNIKPSTRYTYESGLKHILPSFEKVHLSDFAPQHIEELLRRKQQDKLSNKTVRNLLGLLQGIFSLAVDSDLIAKSPIRDKHKPALNRIEKTSWSAEQIRRIVDGVPVAYGPLFMFAALTGARLGEILGIQWKHIDFDNRSLDIRQSLWNGQLQPPKTQSSNRTIRFGEGLFQALRTQLELSEHIGQSDYVFCKEDGSPLHPDILRRDVLYPTLDRLQIPRRARSAGFHCFRHSAASIINAETGNMKIAQKLLGHSNLNITADLYTHTSADEEAKAAVALEGAILGYLFHDVPKTGNNIGLPAA